MQNAILAGILNATFGTDGEAGFIGSGVRPENLPIVEHPVHGLAFPPDPVPCTTALGRRARVQRLVCATGGTVRNPDEYCFAEYCVTDRYLSADG